MKLFVCHLCTKYKTFKNAKGLKSHILYVHEAIRKFKCSSCIRTFTRNYELKRHNNRVHNKSKIPATVQPKIKTPEFFDVTKPKSAVTNFDEEIPNSIIFPEIVNQESLDSNNFRLSNELNEICAELNIDIQTKTPVDFKTVKMNFKDEEIDIKDWKPESIIENVKSETGESLDETVPLKQQDISEVLIPNLLVKQENLEKNELEDDRLNIKSEGLSQNPNNYLLSTIPEIDIVAENFEFFICHICDQSFNTFSMLENHLLKVHERCENVSKITCTFCNKTFKKEKYLLEHDKFFHQNLKFKCTESGCDKTFRRKGKLMNHIAKIHSESEFYFTNKVIESKMLNENIITKITDSENAAMVSILPTTSYEENKVYENQMQGPQHPNNFGSSTNKVVENKMLNQNIIPKITDSGNTSMVSIFPTTSFEENKVYENQIQVPQHPNNFGSSQKIKKIHEICNKQKLISTKIVTPIIPKETAKLICHICNKKIADLKKHVSKVHGPRNFKCEICNKTFKYPSDLKRHKSNVHFGIKRRNIHTPDHVKSDSSTPIIYAPLKERDLNKNISKDVITKISFENELNFISPVLNESKMEIDEFDSDRKMIQKEEEEINTAVKFLLKESEATIPFNKF